MSTAATETAVWIDTSGLRCVVVALPDSVGHRVTLIRCDGFVTRERSVTSCIEASLLAFHWYEETSRRRAAVARPSLIGPSRSRRQPFELLK
jgi:hypothetical protein